MVVLTDDQQNPMSIPTKQNMKRAMQWLVSGVKPNDSLFFHYSGRDIHHVSGVALANCWRLKATEDRPQILTGMRRMALSMYMDS